MSKGSGPESQAAPPLRNRLPLQRLAQTVRQCPYAWITGLALAWCLLEISYSWGFCWEKTFLEHYAGFLAYWLGQHREHRLYGEFHYYLPLLTLYRPFIAVLLLAAVLRWLTLREARIVRLGGTALAALIGLSDKRRHPRVG